MMKKILAALAGLALLTGCMFRADVGPVTFYIEANPFVPTAEVWPEATASPTPAPICTATITSASGVNVRTGPGIGFGVLRTYAHLATVSVQPGGGDWWQLVAAPGWVSAQWVRVVCQ